MMSFITFLKDFIFPFLCEIFPKNLLIIFLLSVDRNTSDSYLPFVLCERRNRFLEAETNKVWSAFPIRRDKPYLSLSLSLLSPHFPARGLRFELTMAAATLPAIVPNRLTARAQLPIRSAPAAAGAAAGGRARAAGLAVKATATAEQPAAPVRSTPTKAVVLVDKAEADKLQRLKTAYLERIVPILKEEFGYTNIHEVLTFHSSSSSGGILVAPIRVSGSAGAED